MRKAYKPLRDRAKLNTVVAFQLAGIQLQAASLETIGHSKNTSNTFLVAMYRAGYLSRTGKRGLGYSYLPTEKFWPFYVKVSDNEFLRSAASLMFWSGEYYQDNQWGHEQEIPY
jgi:hypothetical protein